MNMAKLIRQWGVLLPPVLFCALASYVSTFSASMAQPTAVYLPLVFGGPDETGSRAQASENLRCY
jgi:hypothetical protein